MGDKPVTTTFLVGGLLWALWHWRRRRLDGATGGPALFGGATSDPYSPEKGQDGFGGGKSRGHGATGTWEAAVPFDAGARLAGLAS